MPVYSYRCDNCGVQFEKKQSFSDPVLKVCPECGKKALHKIYTPVGIVFKGSGFYATDHRSPSGQTSKSHNEEKSTAAATGEPSKSETKSESKSESSTSGETSKD